MTSSVSIRDDEIIFRSTGDVPGRVESKLKHRYSPGLFIHDVSDAPDGGFLVKLGVAYAKDVSDRRERDQVMKFINVGSIETIHFESTGSNYYRAVLPDREEFHEKFMEKRREIVNRLDWSMAKAIFEDIYYLNPVRNQLSSIIDIVNFLGREGSLSIERLDRIQGQANTREYLQVMEEFDFVRIDSGDVYQGRKMEAVDMDDRSPESFEKQVIGQLVKDAYYVLRDDLELNMLKHFPRYANAYYYSAIQKDDPELWLDTTSIRENLHSEWGIKTDPLIVDKKMRQLDEAGVVERDGDYIGGKNDIYLEVRNEAVELELAG